VKGSDDFVEVRVFLRLMPAICFARLGALLQFDEAVANGFLKKLSGALACAARDMACCGLLLGGCSFDLSAAVPVGDASADNQARSEPDAQASPQDAQVAGDAGGEPLPQEGDASALPIRHGSCINALPEVLPELRYIPVTATGRPWFDAYRDISCTGVMNEPTCNADDECESGTCVHEEGKPGLCSVLDNDLSRQVISFAGGTCLSRVSAESQAMACCLRLAGFSCRKWPYEAREQSQQGELCARHEDCQGGLVCRVGDIANQGFGICLCPEAPVEWDECP
jgi:hypothetical protein